MIELKGRPVSILGKNNRHLIFIIDDPDHGTVVCNARKDSCPLYYNLNFDKVYKLQVKLSGHSVMKPDGREVYNNSLIITKTMEAE